jgi:hypothetical protein
VNNLPNFAADALGLASRLRPGTSERSSDIRASSLANFFSS